MLIILKSFLLLNSSARSIINWCLLVLYNNPALFIAQLTVAIV